MTSRSIARRLDRIELAIPLRSPANDSLHVCANTSSALERALRPRSRRWCGVSATANSLCWAPRLSRFCSVLTKQRVMRQDSKCCGQTLSNLDFLNDENDNRAIESSN
jgi:hypothetical protein